MFVLLVHFAIYGTLYFGGLTTGCGMHSYGPSDFDPIATAAQNNRIREKRGRINCTTKVAIENVQVFDGFQLLPPMTVVVDGDKIGIDPVGAEMIDGTGLTLLPGLIDSHSHPDNTTHLEMLSSWGVTTTFEMATFIPELGESLKNHSGLTDVFLASAPACAPGSTHGNITARTDPTLLIANDSEVPAWLERQFNWNPDFMKLIAESPGLDQLALNMLTAVSHQHNKKVICHTNSHDSALQAMTAGVDQIHHSTLDVPITKEIALQILAQKQISVPTLAIMLAIISIRPQASYAAAQETVTIYHEVGVPILVGTDANMQPGVIVEVPFGISLHEELGLLVEAGLSNLEVLRAATSLPAEHWGLRDRGRIAPGMRADLVLIEGNPLQNISVTKNIKKVWLNGVEFAGPLFQ